MFKLVALDKAGTTVNDRDEVFCVYRAVPEREGAQFTDEQFQQFVSVLGYGSARN